MCNIFYTRTIRYTPIATLLLMAANAVAQTGPAGVEQTNGASNLLLWLDGNIGVEEAANNPAENNDAVFRWLDQSGNGNNGVLGVSPVFQTNQNNAFPAVNFNGTNDRLNLTAGGLPLGNVDRTYIFVADGTAVNAQTLIAHGTNVNGQKIGVTHSTTETSIAVGGHKFGITFGANAADRISSIVLPNGLTNSNQFDIYNNGNGPLGATLSGTTRAVNTGATTARICANIGTSFFYAGDLSEVIVFDKELNTAELICVHNYLSAKYAIALTANDLYDEDNVGNGNYDFEVAGIGRADAANIHNDAQGTGIVRILNPTGLDNGEYYIWGHDDGALASEDVTDFPAGEGVEGRIERVWRGSETGTITDFDVRFDLTSITGGQVAADLCLLIDIDNDGLFNDETVAGGGVIIGSTAIGGNVFEFANVTVMNNNLRFTLGTVDMANTPLPMELLSFDAQCHKDDVIIRWETMSENGTEYFIVERSVDALNWEDVEKTQGAENSSRKTSYKIIDSTPFSGTSYYRLKQVNSSGTVDYSKIKTVTKDGPVVHHLTLYPNPVKENMTVKFSLTRTSTINIILLNSIGQEARVITNKKMFKGDHTLDLQVPKHLNSGAYQMIIEGQEGKIGSKGFILD